MALPRRIFSAPVAASRLRIDRDKLKSRYSSHGALSRTGREVAAEIEEAQCEWEKAAGFEGQLFSTHGSCCWQVLKMLLCERRTFKIALACAGLYILACGVFTLLNFFRGTNLMQLGNTVERYDVDAFYTSLRYFVWIEVARVHTILVMQWTLYKLRVLVAWRFTFRLIHALFTGNSFYRLQATSSGRNPEQVISEESTFFCHFLQHNLQQVMMAVMTILVSAYSVLLFRPMLLLLTLALCPIHFLTLKWLIGKLSPYQQVEIEQRQEVAFQLTRVQDNAEQIALFQGSSSDLERVQRQMERGLWAGVLLGIKAQVCTQCAQLIFLAAYVPAGVLLLKDVMQGVHSMADAMLYFGQIAEIQESLKGLAAQIPTFTAMEAQARQFLLLHGHYERCQLQERQRQQQQRRRHGQHGWCSSGSDTTASESECSPKSAPAAVGGASSIVEGVYLCTKQSVTWTLHQQDSDVAATSHPDRGCFRGAVHGDTVRFFVYGATREGTVLPNGDIDWPTGVWTRLKGNDCIGIFEVEAKACGSLELRDVELWTPANQARPPSPILQGLSLHLAPSESLLIVGETGTGKSALLRSIHGLWFTGRGCIRRCPTSEVCCVPQRPYMFLGSIRENLTYPDFQHTAEISDAEIRRTLESVNLGLALRACSLDEVHPWYDLLSLGQQQRLAIARILLRPAVSLLLLDEATSALDLANERVVYDRLRERCPCYVSVAHRPSVRQYHTHVAVLSANPGAAELGGPQVQAHFSPIAEYNFGKLKSVTGTEPPPKEGEDLDKDEILKSLPGEKVFDGIGVKKLFTERTAPTAHLSATEAEARELASALSQALGYVSASATAYWARALELRCLAMLCQWAVRIAQHMLWWSRWFWSWLRLSWLLWQALPSLPIRRSLCRSASATCRSRRSGVALWIQVIWDLVYPMVSRTDPKVLRPAAAVVLLGLTASMASMVMQGVCLQRIMGFLSSVRDQREISVLWQRGPPVLLVYLPISLLASGVGSLGVETIHKVAIYLVRKDFAQRYLSSATRAYYHLQMQRRIEMPGGQIVSIQVDNGVSWWILTLLTVCKLGAVLTTLYALSDMLRKAPAVIVLYFIFIGTGLLIVGRVFTPVLGHFEAWNTGLRVLSAHVLHARENAEAVALLNGGAAERQIGFESMDRSNSPSDKFIWANQMSQFSAQFYLHRGFELFTYLFIAPLVFMRQASLGEFYFVKHLLDKATSQVHELLNLLLAQVDGQMGMRVMLDLNEALNEVEAYGHFRGGAGPSDVIDIYHLQAGPHTGDRPECTLELKDVTLRTPQTLAGLKSRPLFEGLSLRLVAGDSLLIAGESGIGKSSLVRAVAGLWFRGQGSIRCIGGTESVFVAQRPYMCTGSLREQLLYPLCSREVEEDRLLEVLDQVRLRHLLQQYGLDEPGEKGWWMRLSLGEVQRISFARLLLRDGLRLVLLDEATSALSPEMEALLYEALRARAASFVSVAHRPELRRFHSTALVMEPDETGGEEAGIAACRLLPMAAYERELEARISGAGAAA